jgi:hypothetical protein
MKQRYGSARQRSAISVGTKALVVSHAKQHSYPMDLNKLKAVKKQLQVGRNDLYRAVQP